MHFPLSFCKNASPYFFHGAFAPSFIWSRRPWSETKKSVLVLILHALVLVLVLQVLRCVVKYSLVTLVVLNDLGGHSSFSNTTGSLVSLFCAWNISAVEINSGVHLLNG